MGKTYRSSLSYLLANEYINTSIQKQEMLGYSVCLKNAPVISHVIWEAKRNNISLSDDRWILPNILKCVPPGILKYQKLIKVVSLIKSY